MNKEVYEKWVADRGDETLRIDYSLNKNSIVFDVGGYKGEWSDKIVKKYGCQPFIFEPIREYYNVLVSRYPANNRIYNVALSSKTQESIMSIDNDGSSVVIKGGKPIEVIKEQDIVEFIKLNSIDHIDLLKLNVEGMEYPILTHLIKTQYIKQVTDLQVQFHDIDNTSKEKMLMLQRKLSITHRLTYQYEFCWENWRLR